MGNKKEALYAVERAKDSLKNKNYREARNSIKKAMELFPSLENGLEMLIVCEILCYASMDVPNCGTDWYSALHLDPSATHTEVENQCKRLTDHIFQIKELDFPGAKDALDHLDHAKSILCDKSRRDDYDSKRKDLGLTDVQDSGKKTRGRPPSFQKFYLDWKPPVLSSEGAVETAKSCLQISVGTKEEAQDVVETVRSSLKNKNYEEARNMMKNAMELFPDLENGLEMLVVCETLHYASIDVPNFGIDWYSVLHLDPSATHTEVKHQCEKLRTYITLIEELGFPGAKDAFDQLVYAESILCNEDKRDDYDFKRRDSGLIDSQDSRKKSRGRPPSFQKLYLDWKPPVFSSEDALETASRYLSISVGNKEEAQDTVETAKRSLKSKNYREARYLMKKAMELFPNLESGVEMLIVCETLYYASMEFPNCGIDWYSVLHLDPSATHTEVKDQCEKLMAYITPTKELEFPGAADALYLLDDAKSVLCDEDKRDDYDSKRRASGLIDLLDSGKRTCGKTSFQELYLDWKPPVFSSEDALETAKSSLKKKNYKEARNSMKKVLGLFPNLENGLEMLIVSEILYYASMDFPNCGIDWYSVLHLDPSATHTEVKNQCDKLTAYITLIKELPGAEDALDLLHDAESVLGNEDTRDDYDSKRRDSGLINLPDTSIKTCGRRSFQRLYLDWKPPVFNSDVADHVESRKRSNTSTSPRYGDDQEPRSKKLKKRDFNDTFVDVSKEIQKLDMKTFWSELDGIVAQLTHLEELGYSVEKLEERLDTLRRIAECHKVLEETKEIFEREIRFDKAKITDIKSQIIELEVGIKESKDRIFEFEAQIDVSEIQVDKCSSKVNALNKNLIAAVEEFESKAKSKLD